MTEAADQFHDSLSDYEFCDILSNQAGSGVADEIKKNPTVKDSNLNETFEILDSKQSKKKKKSKPTIDSVEKCLKHLHTTKSNKELSFIDRLDKVYYKFQKSSNFVPLEGCRQLIIKAAIEMLFFQIYSLNHKLCRTNKKSVRDLFKNIKNGCWRLFLIEIRNEIFKILG